MFDTARADRQLIRFIVRSLFLDASGYQTVLDAIPKVGTDSRDMSSSWSWTASSQSPDACVVADGQVGGDLTKLDGLREAALVVRAVTGGLQQGWPCPEVWFSLLVFPFVSLFLSHSLTFLCVSISPVSLLVPV